MIRSFGDSRTRRVFDGQSPKGFPTNIVAVAFRKLITINNATTIADLRYPPGNHLESLQGSLTGFHSIRINSQWRIIFRWSDENAEDVRIVDYH